MPRTFHSAQRTTHPSRTHTALRSVGAIITVAVLGLTTSCVGTAENVAASRVLQSVNVSLAGDGSIAAIDGTAISVDEATGRSSSADTRYETSTVADDLPVRVTTQYRAEKKSGNNLTELNGYTGRVEIDLSVENLTVAPRTLSYDVAGQSRTEPGLIGAPLTIAASTTLPGIDPSSIVRGSDNGATGTNGVISATPKGDTVIQWATLLAPPMSGASATLRLVANVTDFSAPAINLAVQPGFSTDLSTDGVLTSAFNRSTTSELALQRRTISLIADVNDVLSRAGATITEVHTNLDSTSQTLGVRTAQQLHDSSQSLASTLTGLGRQLSELKTDLSATVAESQSTTINQLTTTVNAMDTMLGDTTTVAPRPVVNGRGCSAVVAPAGTASSIYSSLLLMSAQLEGYSGTTASCRDEVSQTLRSTVGPATPSAQTCTSASMTCALFGSAIAVQSALLALVGNGNDLVAGLQPEIMATALARFADVSADFTTITTQVTNLSATASRDKANAAAKALLTAVSTAKDRLHDIDDQVNSLHTVARNAQKSIGGTTVRGSMLRQNADAADRLCQMSQAGLIPLTAAEEVRSLLTDVPCVPAGEPDPAASPPPALTPSLGYKTALDKRLQEQSDSWNTVLKASDIHDHNAGVGQSLQHTRDDIAEISSTLTDFIAALHDGNGSLDEAIAALGKSVTTVTAHKNTLGERLGALDTQQRELGTKIRDAFTGTATAASRTITALIQNQIRVVSDEGARNAASVVGAFDRSISGLSTTAQDVAQDARKTVDQQHQALEQRRSALTAAITEQTTASLERIAEHTGASTRDVEAAATLLGADLSKVMLDLGDRQVNGSGLLGSMVTSAAKAGTADYQLALATQNAQGYANIRAEDVAGILSRRAQLTASIDAGTALSAFHLNVPSGATSQTLYSFSIGGKK